jgi:hypothetical protein
MSADLGSLFNLYQFSTGRRIYALQLVLKTAKKLKFTELEVHLALAIRHDRATRKLDAQWQAQGGQPKGQGAAPRVDTLVDKTLTGLRDAAAAQAAGAAADDDIAEKVAQFIGEIFPAGVASITHLSYLDELSAVDAIVAKLKGELAPLVVELGLTRLANRLASLAVEYRAALEAPPPPALSFGTVRAARALGQENLLQAVALIVGRYYKSTPDHRGPRAALLDPILKQDEAIAHYLRSRRTIEDVNPETGEVETEPLDPMETGDPVAEAPTLELPIVR